MWTQRQTQLAIVLAVVGLIFEIIGFVTAFVSAFRESYNEAHTVGGNFRKPQFQETPSVHDFSPPTAIACSRTSVRQYQQQE
jgi:hypothetical protein